MQDKPIDLERFDETAPFEVLSSLSRSINWVIKNIHKGTYQDIDSMSNIITCLHSIVDNGFQQFIYGEEDHPEELPIRLVTDHQKLVWIDTELRYFEKSFDLLHDFLSIISNESENGEWDRIALLDYENKGIFSFCFSNCDVKYCCLYVFKELFPIFTPSYVFRRQDSIIRKQFERNSSKIATILERNFTSSDKDTGWTYKAGALNECGVDAYVTASLLVSLEKWKGYENIIKQATNFLNSNTIKSCIKSIQKLQVPDGKHAGGWKEIYANKEEYRVRTAAKIAISLFTLRQMGFNIGFDTIENMIKQAREFMKRSLTEEGTCSDMSCFSDVTKARESDIPGTIALIELDLTWGKEGPRGLDTVYRVNWLLNQQRYDGSWPILSKSLLDSSKVSGNTSIKIGPEEHNEENISLNNTVDAIRTLILYYKSYLTELDARLASKR